MISLRRLASVMLGLVLVTAPMAQAAPMQREAVPAPLQPWIGWVLHDQPSAFCAGRHDDGERLCHWPSQLGLDLDARGGRFVFEARLDAPGWLLLPGDARALPIEVRDQGRAVPVLMSKGRPALWAAAGEHRVEGRYAWNALPESLSLPPQTGLVNLRLEGEAVAHPARDTEHRLWLGRTAAAPGQAAHLSLRVFRLVDDDVPLQVHTQVQIDAGGDIREELIGPVLLPGLVPLSIEGDLPARLEADGRLRVQVRPGTWTLRLLARSSAPVAALSAPAAAAGWPAQEVWSLQTHPELRVIEAGGVPAADPRQTGTPEPWQSLPAFVLEPGASLKLEEKQRGNPQPEPDQLQLDRELWLDFDGGGWTLRDQLGGRLSRTWRLDVQAPLALGQVLLDQQPQLITTQDGATGVEVRHGQLQLLADSRIDGALRTLPASGWSTDLQAVNLSLHLPPAWRLIAAPGADNVPDTWLSRWSLLDLFLVLIAAIAALRLFGRGTALLTLVTLALTWHEPGAPRWTWLHLIAAIALLRAIPPSFDGGRLRRVLQAWQWVAVGALALVALPWAVQQARSSLYPQLEPAGGSMDYHGQPPLAPDRVSAAADAMVESEPEEIAVTGSLVPRPPGMNERAESYSGSAKQEQAYSRQSIQQLAPNVLTQTGPGLPQWSWQSAQLSWSGPVSAGQSFQLWLIPPWLTRLLGAISILLVAVLAARWLGLASPGLRPPPKAAGAMMLGGTALLLALIQTPAQAQVEPTGVVPPQPDLLAQLRERLTAPPDCLPDCASWSRLGLAVRDERLILRLDAEAAVDTALPLPVPPLGGVDQGRVWQPSEVLLDGRPADLLRRPDGQLWLRVPAGRHEVVASGSMAGFSTLQLPLPERPSRIESDTPGWILSGLDRDGLPGSTLQLGRERAAAETAPESPGSSQALPPMLRLTRTLRLGLTWTVESSLERIGNAQAAQLVSLALLPGETVTGEGVRQAGGTVQASFAPGQSQLAWTSRLDTVPELKLSAAARPELFETWRIDASPLWHLAFAGLAPVQHQQDGWWLSVFRPWPGESLELRITRPAAVAGQVLTLERADLQVRPGARARDYDLALSLRSSQGGQHALALPAGITAQGVSIDGNPQPLRQENGRAILPLRPGAQEIALTLRQEEGLSTLLRTPALDLGMAGVNARIDLSMPENRWVLLAGGPALGPAVLFWGVLVVLVAVAIGLGRSGLTPLRTMQWVLLIIGLSQLPLWGAALVAGWLYALAVRRRLPETWSAGRFNAAQVLLALWTLLALGLLFGAVAQGLLGTPDMQIAGNGSGGGQLRWYQDRHEGVLPTAWVLSVSIWFYRGLMLLWALWLANSLLGWLRWGWDCYNSGGLWKKSARIAPTTTAGAPPR